MRQPENLSSVPNPTFLEEGLSEEVARALLAEESRRPKSLPASRSYWDIIRENVFTFINICLFGLGLTLLLLGRVGDALVSTGVISLNVIASVVQEIRAKRTLDQIALLTRPTATVIREGAEHTVAPEALVTGDDPETVAALARQVGLFPLKSQVISGPQLNQLSDAEFTAAAESGTIFGRITPQQKARLISALRAQGYYVAMIGDGVNDVLALKQAQLAIALQSGSQATRSVADVILMQDSFAVLVPAVIEGQRIQSGMQDVLKLFLTRIATVGLVIFSALVVGVFPLELRQGSIVTLFSVGIPTVFLVLWARPTPLPRNGLVQRLLHFILPPVVTTSVLALLLFAGMYLLHHTPASGPLVPTGGLSSPEEALAIAETALTAFLVCSGLVLIIFVQPPTAWWVGGSAIGGEWRPTWLAIGLLATFVIISLVPGLRSLFLLAPLGPADYGLVAVAVVVWIFTVRWIWRSRLFERFLGVDLGSV